MTCTYAGELRCTDPDTDAPAVAVWVCHACPGGVLVLDPHDHQLHAHPAGPAIPVQRHAEDTS